MTREDDHPIAEVFRTVCRERLGRVPVVECYVDDNTEADMILVRLVMVTGVWRIDLAPFTVDGAAKMTDEGFYRELRREMRTWFKGVNH